MSRETWIKSGVVAVALVAAVSLPVFAGREGGKACGVADVASVDGGKACGAASVASVDGAKACGAAAVASVDGGKSCGAGALMAVDAVADKSCAAPEGVLASVDGKEGKACSSCHAKGEKAMASADGDKLCPKWTGKQVEAVLARLDAAEKAIQSGDSKVALAALADVRASLKQVHDRADKAVASVDGAAKHDHKAHKAGEAKGEVAAYANAKCPIMGSPINPEKVKPALVRSFEGQKVAFCCGGCPAAWDKLSDEQKTAKLQAAK